MVCTYIDVVGLHELNNHLGPVSYTHLDVYKRQIVEFVDIAGLVKGASQGAGLGNKFLGHIRECDAIVHLSLIHI